MRKIKFSCQKNGLTIRGHVWREKEGILPAIILSHAFMANEKMCYGYARLFAGLGYAAYTYDFCGGGVGCSSDGKTQDMTVVTEQEDLECVLQYVQEQPDIDCGNISLLGCSQGGLVSALVAGEHSEIKNLVLLYPALCIPDDARAGKMLMFQFDPNAIPDIVCRFPMKIGKGYPEAVMNWDYKEIVKGYQGKVILIHGTKDRVVDIAYAREASKIIADCHYYEIEDGGHVFRRKHDQQVHQILQAEMKL